MDFPNLPGDEIIGGITFATVDVDLPIFNADQVASWLTAVAKSYDRSIGSLSYVLCSDAYLLEMNVERLNHDSYTDIITFDLRDADDASLEGECYISLDRVIENATSFGESAIQELFRVFVHGLLHLCGLGDKTAEDAKQMRQAEDRALALLLV